MKSALCSHIIILVFSSFSFAAGGTAYSLICRNEAHSAVTASLNLNDSQIILVYGSVADNSSLEQDIKNKNANLKIDKSSSGKGWVEYAGEVATNNAFGEYRTIEVRLQPSHLKSPKEFHTTFAISESHEKSDDPSVFSSYGMICKIR